MIDLNKVVFLVDGKTEIKALKEKFSTDYGITPALRRTGCNGKSVTAAGYVAASIGTLLMALRGRFLHIICIIDREQRAISAANFAERVRKTIIDELTANSQYRRVDLEQKTRVCVPDRMFENWIIADVAGIKVHRNLISETAQQSEFDGTNGASELRKMMRVRYKKIMHGSTLFKSISFARAKRFSASFLCFTQAIGC